MSSSIRVAIAHSRITADVIENGRHIRALMTQACDEGARLAQFPEGALSGYSKSQVKHWSAFDWPAIEAEQRLIAAHARSLGLWTVLGCSHRLTPPHRPHNSLYVIAPSGDLVGRYDKQYCSNTEVTDWYTPGGEALAFTADGFTFGCALCIEIQFPELFARYERLGIDCLLFSAYARDPMYMILAQAHAATNNYWLALSTPANCCAELPASLIGPDGSILARSPAGGGTGLVCHTFDRGDPRFEIALTKARPWRATAREGEIYRARQVVDNRSSRRTEF